MALKREVGGVEGIANDVPSATKIAKPSGGAKLTDQAAAELTDTEARISAAGPQGIGSRGGQPPQATVTPNTPHTTGDAPTTKQAEMAATGGNAAADVFNRPELRALAKDILAEHQDAFDKLLSRLNRVAGNGVDVAAVKNYLAHAASATGGKLTDHQAEILLRRLEIALGESSLPRKFPGALNFSKGRTINDKAIPKPNWTDKFKHEGHHIISYEGILSGTSDKYAGFVRPGFTIDMDDVRRLFGSLAPMDPKTTTNIIDKNGNVIPVLPLGFDFDSIGKWLPVNLNAVVVDGGRLVPHRGIHPGYTAAIYAHLTNIQKLREEALTKAIAGLESPKISPLPFPASTPPLE